MQIQDVSGFEWDHGNRTKCQKHGLSVSEIESAFHRSMRIFPDIDHSQSEPRYIGLGNTTAERNIFICFTLRLHGGKTYIRPVSARYMHKKEVDYYAKTTTNP